MPVDIPQISFGGGAVSPGVYARVDLQKFGSAAARIQNMFVHAEGGSSNRAGTRYINEVKDSAKRVRNVPFEFNEEQAYCLEFGDRYVRVVRNGALVLEAEKAITGATSTNPVVLTVNAHGYSDGEEVFISGVGGMTQINGQFYKVAGATPNSFELQGVDGTGFDAYTSGGTSERVYEIETPYLEADLGTLKFRQSNDVMFVVHRSHAPRRLSRLDHDDWILVEEQFASTLSAPTGVNTTNNGTGNKVNGYVVTAFNEETGEESIVSSRVVAVNDFGEIGFFVRVAWASVPGATKYNIYKDEDGSLFYGYIGSSASLTFTDNNIAPDFADTPPTSNRNPFAAAGDYPGAVGLHEQRIAYGGSTNTPLTTEMSQTSQFQNFNKSSPTRDSDAVAFRTVTGQGNEIRHYRSFRDRLFVFTSGAVWSARPGGDVDAITPASKKVSVELYLSATDVPPLTIKENMLMVSGPNNRGYEVHSIGVSVDTLGYSGSDLTVLARHLFETHTIREWAYIERPHRLVVAVRDDGVILCMSYLEEHQVYAWSEWTTDGAFESVASVPEGSEDALYVIVRRTVDGVARRYQERLHTRQFTEIEGAFFVDSGLTYTGTATSQISGLSHLEGKGVVALADGNLVQGLTVADGAVTLPDAASVVHVGLPFLPLIESMPLNAGRATMAKRKAISKVALRVLSARGISAGPDEANLQTYPARESEPWGAPAGLRTGVIELPISSDWELDRSIVVVGEAGLPMTVLAMMPQFD